MSIISNWDPANTKLAKNIGKVHSCLSCYVKTKPGCGFKADKFRLIAQDFGAPAPIPEQDELADDPSEHSEAGPNAMSSPAAEPTNHPTDDEPDLFDGAITRAPNTPTPATKKRPAPDNPSPFADSDAPPVKKTKPIGPDREDPNPSLLTPQGLPNNPKRPLPPAPTFNPELWLQSQAAKRQISENDPKGKSRDRSERPQQSPNPHPTTLPATYTPANPTPGRETTIPNPGRFVPADRALPAPQLSFSPVSHGPHLSQATSVTEMISENRTAIKGSFEATRDGLRDLLVNFEASQDRIDKKLVEQYRLLEDANGAKERAVRELELAQQVAKSLKSQNIAVEDRNADLSKKNRLLTTSVGDLEEQREKEGAKHKDEIEKLVAAKEAAEALQDAATQERKKAFAERDSAIEEATNSKVSEGIAEQVVQAAVDDKTAAQGALVESQNQVKKQEGELETLRAELDSLRAYQLGLAGPSSYAHDPNSS